MQKDNITKIEDSNIANYGSQAHTDAKDAKAKSEKEWKGAGKKVGVECWRVENFGVKKQKSADFGKLYQGDSYLILKTYKVEGKEAFKWNLHFWLGSETTQDESGTAAFKTVELDDFLGGGPVQYRECQGHESSAFLKLFPTGLVVMAGGIAGAFNKVKPTEYRPRLMHFKGKKNIRVTEVKLERASLNQGDVFLLDNGMELIQWNGPTSSALERRKALVTLTHIKDERNGRPKSRVLDGAEEDDVFWGLLGGMGPIAHATADKKVAATAPKIFSVSDETGTLECKEVATGKTEMKKSVLNNDDVFIVDEGHHVYIWVGINSTKAEKSGAMKQAVDYLTANNRPMWTPISRVLSGGESTAFNAIFGGASM